MIYLYLYGLSFISSIVQFARQKEIRLLLGFILIVSIGFVVSFRFESVDYYSYQRIYDGLEWDFSKFSFFIYDLNHSTPIETGFAVFNLIVKSTFDSFYFFIALFSIVSLTIKYTAFKKMSPYFLVSILLYLSDEYFWKDMGQIRNAMASGVVLWALYFAFKHRFFLFSFLVILAMLFHSAAIVAFPFYFVRYLSSRLLMLLAIVISILVAYFYGGLSTLLLQLAESIGFSESSRIIKYADSKYAEGIRLGGGTFLIRLSLVFLCISLYANLSRVWNINKFYIPIYVYSVAILFLFNDYEIIGSRVYDMLAMPIACIIIPSFILLFKGYERVLVLGVIFTYSLVWFLAMFFNAAPYQSIFGA